MDFLHGPASQITNTDLAAALGTLGIPRDAENPLIVLAGEMEQVGFMFCELSDCGTYSASEMVPLWDDGNLPRTHPKHALTYMRIGLRSRARLINYAHGKERVGMVARPGGQIEVITTVAGATGSRSSSPAPDSATTPRLHVEDLELAAALLACGIPLWKDMPISRTAERLAFFFMPASPCGLFNARQLMLAWQDRQWHAKHPEHPFAYLSCVFENRRRLLREVKQKQPLAVFLRAGFPHFLSLNADARTETLFMKELKKL
jgi:hypothetical protein